MIFEKLIQKLKDQDLKPRSYSGRGMYGENCVGVYVKNVGDHSLPSGFRFDNLGLGYIIYWPSVKWKGE